MTSLHECLKLKQYQMDAWTTREQLCLASAVLRSGSGDQNWIAVSRIIKSLTSEHDRPLDWYSTKNCALQYAKLLEQVETPKRKREKNEPPINESPGEIVTKMLSKQRVEELKGILEEEKASYSQLYKEVKLLETNVMDDRLHQMWEEAIREQELEDDEEERCQIWLKEREDKIKATQLALKSPIKSQQVSPPKRKSCDSISPVLEDQNTVDDTSMVVEDGNKDVEMESQVSNPTSSSEDSNSKSTIIDSDIASESLSNENQLAQQISEFDFTKKVITDEPQASSVITESENEINIKKGTDNKTADDFLSVPKVEHNPYLFIDDDSELTSCVYVSEKVSKAKLEKFELKSEKEKVIKGSVKIDLDAEKDNNSSKISSSEVVPEKLFNADEVYTYHEEPEEKTKRDYTRRRDFHKEDPFKLITEVREQAKQLTELENSLMKLEKSKLDAKAIQDQKNNDLIEPISSATLLDAPGGSQMIKVEECEGSFDGENKFWIKSDDDTVKDEDVKSSKRKKKCFFQKKDEIKDETKIEKKEIIKTEDDKKDLALNIDSDESNQKFSMDAKFCEEFSNLSSPPGSIMQFDVPIKLLAKNEKKEDAKFESDNESLRDDESSSYRGCRTRDDDFEDVSRDSMDLSLLRDYSVRSDRRKISESVSSPRVSESTPSSPASTHYGDDLESEKAHRMWKRSIMLLWKDIASHKNASIFLKPITEDRAPGYHSIVHKPMDLFKIKRHIDSGYIRTFAEFHRDILLMFMNAKMYNASDHNVSIMSAEMFTDAVASLEEHIGAAQTVINTVTETTVTPKTLRREMRETITKLSSSERKRKREDTSGDEKRRKN